MGRTERKRKILGAGGTDSDTGSITVIRALIPILNPISSRCKKKTCNRPFPPRIFFFKTQKRLYSVGRGGVVPESTWIPTGYHIIS